MVDVPLSGTARGRAAELDFKEDNSRPRRPRVPTLSNCVDRKDFAPLYLSTWNWTNGWTHKPTARRYSTLFEADVIRIILESSVTL